MKSKHLKKANVELLRQYLKARETVRLKPWESNGSRADLPPLTRIQAERAADALVEKGEAVLEPAANGRALFLEVSK